MKKLLIFIFSMIFLISCNEKDDSSIVNLTLEIGDSHEGGIIFYLDSSGDHGLIASKADQGEAIWGCIASLSPTAQSTTIGSGNANTQAIVTNCPENNIAAKICANLSLNGYDDWFLPAIETVELMYTTRNIIGGFDESNVSAYISSSEFFPVGTGEYLNCWVYDFSAIQIVPTSRKLNTNKSNSNKIRAVRAF